MNRKSAKSYEIGKFAYRELYYFCLQYYEYKREIDRIANSIGNTDYNAIRGGAKNISDPTAVKALKIALLESKCELIEQTALATDPYIYQALLKNVTTGVSYEQMKACDVEILCGRRQFYEKRKLFFFLLNLKKEGNAQAYKTC